MSVKEEIRSFIDSQPEPKRVELQKLHRVILAINPKCKLWFLDGKNADGKIVSNPSIGYGAYMMKYSDGSAREFYRIGLSANTSGISVYIMGIEDKKYLSDTYAKDLGKASVTGYCIKFRKLADIDMGVLESAVRFGFEMRGEAVVR
jgi:hypothetical protein